jgi:ankyrin repeat protein
MVAFSFFVAFTYCRCGTYIQIAAEKGFKDIVNILLDAGASINLQHTSYTKGTPLQLAKEAGHKDIVQLLLKRGAK